MAALNYTPCRSSSSSPDYPEDEDVIQMYLDESDGLGMFEDEDVIDLTTSTRDQAIIKPAEDIELVEEVVDLTDDEEKQADDVVEEVIDLTEAKEKQDVIVPAEDAVELVEEIVDLTNANRKQGVIKPTEDVKPVEEVIDLTDDEDLEGIRLKQLSKLVSLTLQCEAAEAGKKRPLRGHTLMKVFDSLGDLISYKDFIKIIEIKERELAAFQKKIYESERSRSIKRKRSPSPAPAAAASSAVLPLKERLLALANYGPDQSNDDSPAKRQRSW